MATNQEVYDDMIQDFYSFDTLTGLTNISDAQTLLDDLSSDSKVANWRLDLWNQAVANKTIMDKFEAEAENIDTIKSTAVVHTGDWYREQCLLMQQGSIVQMVNGYPGYYEVDEDARIVKYAAWEEDLDNDRLILKLRGFDPDVLTSDQMDAMDDYLATIKGVGLNITTISTDADDIRYYGTVVYNPQINLEDLKDTVELALENLVANTAFNSYLKLNDAIDLLQNIEGVEDAQLEYIAAKIWSEVSYNNYDWTYKLISGWGQTNSLDTTINWVAQ